MEPDAQSVLPMQSPYPFEEGDCIVIGPECFAAKDGSVLSWRGENYYRSASEPVVEAD